MQKFLVQKYRILCEFTSIKDFSEVHVDFTNGRGETFIDLLSEGDAARFRQVHHPLNLACLAAKKVAKINPWLTKVPNHFHSFVLGHKK